MRVANRLTGQMREITALSEQDKLLPQYFTLAEDWQYNSGFGLPRGSILSPALFKQLLKTTGKTKYDDELSDTLADAVNAIASQMQVWLLNPDTHLPNPLVPSAILEKSANLNRLESMLEEVIETGHLFHIALQPRMDIRYDEEIIPTSRAKKISNKAPRYLASHSETWQNRTLLGVYPKKLLAKVSDDEIGIYENRVYAKLIDKLINFLRIRIKELKEQEKNLDQAINLENDSGYQYQLTQEICKLWAEVLSMDDTSRVLQNLRNTLLENELLYEQLKKLTTLGLYTKITPSQKAVSDKLHKTNILMHDQHYRHISRLWTELYNNNERHEKLQETLDRQNKLQLSYNFYCLLILLRAFDSLNFTVIESLEDKITVANHNWQVVIAFNRELAIWQVESMFNEIPLRIIGIANSLSNELLSTQNLTETMIVCCLEHDTILVDSTNQIITANPFNLLIVEELTKCLLKWLYSPLYQGYGKILNVGRLPQSIEKFIQEHSVFHKLDNTHIQLAQTLSNSEQQRLEETANKSNANKFLQLIQSELEYLKKLEKCPICSHSSVFEPRLSNRTFIAKCQNLACNIDYYLQSDTHGNRTFTLIHNNQQHQYAGRRSLKFKL